MQRARRAAGTMAVGAKAPTGNYDVKLVTKALSDAGVDFFTCYNGQMGCAVDIDTRKFCCGGPSGTSATMGYGYRAYGLSMTRGAAQAAPIPLIGSGGIINARNVIEPVSYTHLDVYKRQVLQCPECIHYFAFPWLKIT